MSNLAAIILSLVEEAIKDEPAIAAELRVIFTKKDPTPDDWNASRARVTLKSYEDYVPDSAIK